MKTAIIARDISGFNAYVNGSTAYLLGASVPPSSVAEGSGAPALAVVPNYVRLGLTDVEMNQWRDYRDQWNTLHLPYSMKDESRTLAITRKQRNVQKLFIGFATPLLRRMSGSANATIDDASALGFKLTRKKPTHKQTPIQDVPVLAMKAIGGGDVKVFVRTVKDSKRTSKLAGAQIEFRYALLPLDEPRHLQISDLTNQVLSSRSIFFLHTGADSMTKVLFAAVRWIDITNPTLNGQWSTIQMVPVV